MTFPKLQPYIESYREWKKRKFKQQEVTDKEDKMAETFEKRVAEIKRRGPEIFIANLDAEHLELLERAGLKDDIENAPEFLAYLVERQWHLEACEEDYRRRSERREIIVGGTLKQFEAFVKYLKSDWWADRRARPVVLTGPQQPKDLPWLEWSVYRRDDCDDSKAGAIMAMELPQTRIKTIFQMFGFPDRDLFWQEVDEFKRKMKQWGFTEVQPTPDEAKVGNEKTTLPAGFPTTDKGHDRAKKIWKIVRRKEQECARDFKLSYRDKPTPTDTELIDLVNDDPEIDKKYESAKRIRDFAKWGDAGWLE